MSQIYIAPGFTEEPDLIFCSDKCVSNYGIDFASPQSNIFPIDEDRYLHEKEVMGWGDTCSACGKPIKK